MYTGPDVIDIDLPRVRAVNKHNLNQQGDYVLYWMTSARRYHYNAALERAIDLAKGLSKPLLVIECISIRHQFSSERILTFVVQGMVDNNIIFRENKLTYMPWIENHKESGDGMLRKLSERAAVVIVDDYPTYVPRWVMERAGKSCKVRVEAVDSNGIIPMRFADKAHTTAYSFRKHMQRNLLDALTTIPSEDPMKEIDENLEMNKIR